MALKPRLAGGVILREAGWICPLCERVYAPKHYECEHCNRDKKSKYEVTA